MTLVHILHIPSEDVVRRPDGVRWCFTCRKRCEFVFVQSNPVVDPDRPLEDQTAAWYGPSFHVECGTCGTWDGDCFPGTYREWEGL